MWSRRDTDEYRPAPSFFHHATHQEDIKMKGAKRTGGRSCQPLQKKNEKWQKRMRQLAVPAENYKARQELLVGVDIVVGAPMAAL